MQFTNLILFLGVSLTTLVTGTPTSTAQYNSTHVPAHLFKELILKNTNYTTISATNSGLETRAKAEIQCCGAELQGWTGADLTATMKNIGHLKGSGTCLSSGGFCARIACQNNAAIWLCNFKDYDMAPSCPYLAEYALDIMTGCGARSFYPACGQRYDTDGYEVRITGGAKC
ncbi:hypothetical protein HYFRA_00003462 [Hymenoscyphus fraxineus]|uniref:Uncharacterized protein n=1 Tax=Hymenoscyphus fraxineus TaxID=746836 RepID=A0A9N9PSC8_9HELO|nr:hypothetical protein HYFRA_00003462 [Hymenoscyphus fraxineus]